MTRLPLDLYDEGPAPQIIARVPRGMVTQLDELARRRGVKRSQLIREAIARELAAATA